MVCWSRIEGWKSWSCILSTTWREQILTSGSSLHWVGRLKSLPSKCLVSHIPTVATLDFQNWFLRPTRAIIHYLHSNASTNCIWMRLMWMTKTLSFWSPNFLLLKPYPFTAPMHELRNVSIVGHPKLKHLEISNASSLGTFELQEVMNLVSLRCHLLPTACVVDIGNAPKLVHFITNSFLFPLPSCIRDQLQILHHTLDFSIRDQIQILRLELHSIMNVRQILFYF